MGPGHDRHRRPDGCLLHHATRRTGPATLWVIFGEDRFHWDTSLIGISLAAFGILHSLAQAMITGPVTTRLGERRALMLGMIADGAGYILLALATRGWMAFPIMVLLASGGIGMPALQAVLSEQVDEERQGQLQGSLAALTSLTSIVGPLSHGDLCGLYNNVERVGMDCRCRPLLALPAGAASRVLERRRATSRSLIVGTIGLCHAGQGDFRLPVFQSQQVQQY